MEVKNESAVGGSLQISMGVIAKIAQTATMEVEGVKAVSCGTVGVRGMMRRVASRPVIVEFNDDVADLTINLIAQYGYKIPSLCAHVQQNVKDAVQNMTGVTVSRVNIIVAGVAREAASEQAE